MANKHFTVSIAEKGVSLMEDELSKWQQAYLNNPLAQRAVDIVGQLCSSSFDELTTPTGDLFRDALAEALLASNMIEHGKFPKELAYQFIFYFRDLQDTLSVDIIAAHSKDAIKYGLAVGLMLGGQLCSVHVPANM